MNLAFGANAKAMAITATQWQTILLPQRKFIDARIFCIIDHHQTPKGCLQVCFAWILMLCEDNIFL